MDIFTSYNMEIDPEFEFECPKWIDLKDEQQEMDAESFSSGLDSSWFEKEHPLHEPKDKDKKELELRPMIDINDTSESTTTKTTTKSKNPKKSLGFKKSVTLQRREKRRILPEITNNIIQSKKSITGDYEDDQFSQTRDFTPPSMAGSADYNGKSSSPLSALISSPLPCNYNISPSTTNTPRQTLLSKAAINRDGQRKRRRLPTIPTEKQSTQDTTTLLPQRAQSASEQTKLLEFSPQRMHMKSMNLIHQNKLISTRNTTEHENKHDDDLSVEQLLKLHNQKIMASKCKYDGNGHRIRLHESTSTVKPSVSDLCLLNNSGITSQKSKATINRQKAEKMRSVDEQELTNTEYEKRQQLQDNEGNQYKSTIEEETKVISDLNSTYVCVENETESLVTPATIVTTNNEENLSNKYFTLKCEDKDIVKKEDTREAEKEELSIEELLKKHNKKVISSKCKYDSNGRRIQAANPVFCPAPSESETSNKTTLKRTTSQKIPGKTVTTEHSTHNKPKHLRRSLVTGHTIASETVRNNMTSDRNYNDKTVKNDSSSKTLKNQRSMSRTMSSVNAESSRNKYDRPGTSLKRPISTDDVNTSKKNKRKSSTTTLSVSREPQEQQSLIKSDMTTQRNKRRSSTTTLSVSGEPQEQQSLIKSDMTTQRNKHRSSTTTLSVSGEPQEQQSLIKSDMTTQRNKHRSSTTTLSVSREPQEQQSLIKSDMTTQRNKHRSSTTTLSVSGEPQEQQSLIKSDMTTQRNKHRSSTTTLSVSREPQEQQSLIISDMTTQRNKRRSCAVTLTTESKSLNHSNAKNTKRRSCVAAPNTSKTTTMYKVGVKQKRRSCFTPSSTKDEGDDDQLKDLIARHNQRLAKLK